jgi:hypothetical protein
MREHLADARKRRRTDAQRVPLEPASDERAERLAWRLIQRTERGPALLLLDEPLGVLLEDERPRTELPSAPSQRAR